LLPLCVLRHSGDKTFQAQVPSERTARSAVSPAPRWSRLMLDFITPVLALVPYIIILVALAAIPTDALIID
jgi:hypothetical protein